MDIQIDLPKSKISQIKDEHGKVVADEVVRTIETKNETLQWKSNIESCRARFHNVLEEGGLIFPEIKFHANRIKYRVLLVWHPKEEAFKVISVFEKEEQYQTSEQHEIINVVKDDPWSIIDQISG